MEKDNLWIIAIVAIVAIVAMVFMFSNFGGKTYTSKGVNYAVDQTNEGDIAGQALRTQKQYIWVYARQNAGDEIPCDCEVDDCSWGAEEVWCWYYCSCMPNTVVSRRVDW